MGLFDLLGEVVAAPLRIAGTAAKASVRTGGALLTLDAEKLGDVSDDALEELSALLEDAEDALDDY